MTAELRVSIFGSEVEVAVPSELSGAPLNPQAGSVRMHADYADIARTLSRLIEMLGPQLRGDCLIKLAVHQRFGVSRSPECGSQVAEAQLVRTRDPSRS